MNEEEMKILFEVIDEIGEEYEKFVLSRKEKGKKQLSLVEYLLCRQHALDLIRTENSNYGDLFSLPYIY